MKIPLTPPALDLLMNQLSESPEGLKRLMAVIRSGVDPTPRGRYRHWDILRHLTPPEGLSVEEWWIGIKTARRQMSRAVPLLKDKDGEPFKLALVDAIQRMLHEIDQQASGALKGSDQVIGAGTRDTYLIKSLFEEAITSSQLEGASTTREVAKDMLQRGRAPRDRGERMILNNYQAMQFTRSVSRESLTPAIVFQLHHIITEGTLEDPSAAGRFRQADEAVHVYDEVGNTLHVPPAADELKERLQRLCEFANDRGSEPFIHPVVRAIVLHFAVAYDHPFVDGNGRTARALFYWAMAARGYWLCEFLSISRIIRRGPSRYNKAFLYTETDENDLTYFVLDQLDVTVRAIRDLHVHLERKAAELKEARRVLNESPRMHAALNHRQLGLINHALKNPGFVYTITSHRRSHNVSYQTARTDLLELGRLRLLDMGKKRRAFVFQAPPDLKGRLQHATRLLPEPSIPS